MIVGLGLDIAEIDRIERSWERFGERFSNRILHPEEQKQFAARQSGKAIFLASRFAAKEAAAKALGTGFSLGINFQDFCVSNNADGKPELAMHNAALARLQELGGTRLDISITHSRGNAAAVVIISK